MFEDGTGPWRTMSIYFQCSRRLFFNLFRKMRQNENSTSVGRLQNVNKLISSITGE
jgi:hypothetical protein